MDILTKISNFFAGGAIKTISDVVMAYLPPDMSPEKKAEIQLKVAAQEQSNQQAIMTLAYEMDKEFSKRITDLEGTASDLKSLPLVGPILLFLRGAQRPVWGFGVLFLNYQVFSGAWALTDGSQAASAFYAINILVLGFLFGERAVTNVLPYLTQFKGAK